MNLKNIVLHQIITEKNKPIVENYSNQLLPINSDVTDFVDKFLEKFRERRPTYGVFEDDSDNYPFQRYVEDYLSNEDFLDFSLRSMKSLKKILGRNTSIKGGNLIFLHYENLGKQFIVTTMLDETAGFSVNDQELTIEKLQTLNLAQVVRANRLNIDKWQEGKDTYLDFIKGKREVSIFFQEFIGNTDLTSSVVNANNFRSALNDYCQKMDISTDRQSDIKSKLKGYIDRQIEYQQDIEITTLSSLIDPEKPNSFLDFVDENDYKVSGSFRAKSSDFNYFVKSIVKGKGYKLSFDKELLTNGTIERVGNSIMINDVDLEMLENAFNING